MVTDKIITKGKNVKNKGKVIKNIAIIGGNNTIVNFNADTKEYLNTSIQEKKIRKHNVIITGPICNFREGKNYVKERKEEYSFSIDRKTGQRYMRF